MTKLEVLCCLPIPVQFRSTHLLKTPSTPVMPIPSTMSLVSLNGTVSGVGRILPCSKATPKWKKKFFKKSWSKEKSRFSCCPTYPDLYAPVLLFVHLSRYSEHVCLQVQECSQLKQKCKCWNPVIKTTESLRKITVRIFLLPYIVLTKERANTIPQIQKQNADWMKLQSLFSYKCALFYLLHMFLPHFYL